MVSANWLCLAFASWVSATLFAQNPLLDASKLPDHLETPAATSSPQALSPERRGDILMARKMYREAAETYKQASLDSDIIENRSSWASCCRSAAWRSGPNFIITSPRPTPKPA